MLGMERDQASRIHAFRTFGDDRGIDGQARLIRSLEHEIQRDAGETLRVVAATDVGMHAAEPYFKQPSRLGRSRSRHPSQRKQSAPLVERHAMDTMLSRRRRLKIESDID